MSSNSKNPIIKLRELGSSRVVKNFIALGLVQATNYIIPLITIPYVIRVVGTERFGLIALAQSIFIFFIVFIDYGFNLTSTKAASLARNDQSKLSLVFSYTMISKGMLTLLAFSLLLLLVKFIGEFQKEQTLFLIGFSFVVGQSLLPIWFFQGIEQMRYITGLNMISKLVLATLILLIITSEEDYVYVLPMYAAGNLVSSFLGIWIIFKKFHIKFYWPTYRLIKEELIGGWHIFAANLSVSIYMHSSIVILGFLVSKQTLGYYSVVDKIIMTVRSLLQVYYQAIYPQVCIESQKGVESLKSFFKKYFTPFAILVFIGCIGMFLLADPIISLFSGTSSDEMILIFRILCFTPFIVVLNIPFNQSHLAFDLKKQYLSITVAGSVISLILIFVFTYFLEAKGTAIAVIVAESIVTIIFALSLRKSLDKKLFKKITN